MDLIHTSAPTSTSNEISVKEVISDTAAEPLPEGGSADVSAVVETDSMDAIPTDSTLVPEEADGGAQWEIDSSPYESSDSDSSSSDDSSEEASSDDADGDYAMLDPEETARILMQGDGGSDDEGDGSKKKDGGLLRNYK